MALPLNAAVFAAVVLASRLTTIIQGYMFLLLAIFTFAYLPWMRAHIRVCSRTFLCHMQHRSIKLYLAVAVVSFCAVQAILYRRSGFLQIAHAVVIVFINFVCPFWFKVLHKYKKYVMIVMTISYPARYMDHGTLLSHCHHDIGCNVHIVLYITQCNPSVVYPSMVVFFL